MVKKPYRSIPTFVYVPKEREVKITKVSKAILKKLNPSTSLKALKEKILPSPEKERTHTAASTTPSPPKENALDDLLPQPRAKVSRVIPPTVGNVDLSNAEIREAFFNYYDLLSTIIARFAVYPEDARM
mgnify:CR=1 FL=1